MLRLKARRRELPKPPSEFVYIERVGAPALRELPRPFNLDDDEPTPTEPYISGPRKYRLVAPGDEDDGRVLDMSELLEEFDGVGDLPEWIRLDLRDEAREMAGEEPETLAEDEAAGRVAEALLGAAESDTAPELEVDPEPDDEPEPEGG